MILNDAPAGNVTPPLDTQARAVPVMEQSRVPVGAVPPLVTTGVPYVAPPGRVSLKMVCVSAKVPGPVEVLLTVMVQLNVPF